MAVYKNGPEQWKPFEGYAQAGKSGDIIIEDNLDYESPVFLIDWSTGKFRNTSGTFDISGTWTKIINESSFLLSPSASINGVNVIQSTPFPAGSPLSTVWSPAIGDYQYISFWVNTPEDFYNQNNDGHCLVVFDAGNGESVTIYLDGDAASTGAFQVGINFRDQTGDVILQTDVPSGLPINNWHHVVFEIKTDTSKLDENLLSDFAKIYINGEIVLRSVLSTATGVISQQTLDPTMYIAGAGAIGIGVNSSGFQGILGNLNIFSSTRSSLGNVIYRLEKWGASKLHSGIHSFGERVERDIISRQEKYPPSFGGLTATHSTLRPDGFSDSIDISWNPQRPVGSYIYSSNSVPFTGLAATDPLTDGHYRSETKSLFFSDDMTNWEVRTETRQDLYKTVETEDSENYLFFDDSLRVGEDDNLQYRDRIVIDIPIEITSDTTLGSLNRVQANGIEAIETENIAYYNFSTGVFDTIQTNDFIQPFSPAQGVTIEPDRGWKWTWKNLARPIHGGGFPQLDIYEQNYDATLDLSEYLKDDFILEGYEVILEVDHAETGNIAHKSSGFGLSHRLGGITRTNDFGAPLDANGLASSDGKNGLSTKIFTTFLMRQKPYSSDVSVRDDSGTKVRSTQVGAIMTPKYPNTEVELDKAVFVETEFEPNPDDTLLLNGLGRWKGSGTFDGEIGHYIFQANTERDLISYGQTVITTADAQKEQLTQELTQFSNYQASPFDPDYWYSSDQRGLDIINREINNSSEDSGIANLLSDRAQIVYTDFNGISGGTQILEQIVPLQTNEKTERTIPFKQYKLTNPAAYEDVFDSGLEPLFYPGNYEFLYSSYEQSWEGGGNQWSLIEPRMIPPVTGNSEGRTCSDNKIVNIDPYGFDPAFSAQEADFKGANNRWPSSKVGNESPEEPLQGYILRPNDRLIFGICNSISQMQGSYVQSVDGAGNHQGSFVFLHQNELTIKSSANATAKPKLRLFGRYKRKDKFINPTPNLSLFHNADVNEPLFNEDIKDQFDVEEISSYKGSLSDDIIGDDFQATTEITLTLGFPNFDDALNYPYINEPIVGDISGSIELIKAAGFDPSNYDPAGKQIDWKTFNDRVFPGVPLSLNSQTGDYEFVEQGTNVAPSGGSLLLNNNILTQPNEEATFRTCLQFLTNDTKYVWNTIDEGGQGIYRHVRKGGYVLEELTVDGYDTGSDVLNMASSIILEVYNNGNPAFVQYPRNINDFPGLTIDTNMGKHAWQFKQSFSLINVDQIGNSVNGWQLKNVKFIPIILDNGSTIQMTDQNGGSSNLDVGDCFYFTKDINGTINNGTAIKVDLSSNQETPSWSLHLDSSINYLNIFIVVGKGNPVLVTDNNGYDALHTNKSGGSYYDGLGQYAMSGFISVMTAQELYEKIVDIIDFECTNNRSLLLQKDTSNSPSQTFQFPVTKSSEEFYDLLGEIIEQFVSLQNNAYGAVTNSFGTSNGQNYSPSEFVDEFWGFVGQVVMVNNFPTIQKLPFKFGDVDLSNWPVITWDTTKTSTSIFDSYDATVPADPQELAFYEKSVLSLNRKIIARSTEPVPKADIWGSYASGETRTAGLLGSLKKFTKVEDPLFVYQDTVAKIPEGTPRSSMLTASEWTNVDDPISPDLRNDLYKLRDIPEYELEVTSEVVDAVRVFNKDGLYGRLDIQNTSLDGTIVWPSVDANNSTNLSLPIQSWIGVEFPNMYTHNRNAMYLYRGLGSNKDGTIKIYPAASPLVGWSSDGPEPIPDTMVMEPLRGSRWGTMNPTEKKREYWFSRTRYGQPADFIEFGVDGAMSTTISRHASYPFNGPAVLIKLFSRQDPDIEIPLVEYENIALETTPFSESVETVEEQSELTTTVFGQPVTASLAAGVVDGDNLKVNLVGQIGKQAAFQPGNIISRIKRT